MKSGIRVALVTGGNKGIGLAIVRDLCRLFSGDVVLTARDVARGQAAVQQLQAEGLSPRFHQLDIDDLQSIRTLRDFLLKEYGGLDVLVNNAGIAFKVADPTPFHIQAEVTMKTNFFGTRDVCTELLPLIKPQGDLFLSQHPACGLHGHVAPKNPSGGKSKPLMSIICRYLTSGPF
uniref:Carbonyl reductase 1 n=1 Tax=Colobus angolensis palliatus TaxID=336983 RepID=A0A2K5HIW4_COLAP